MKRKLLCIVQLPPPVHGAALMNQSFVSNRLINHHYDLNVIDIATARVIEKIGTFSIRKILGSITTFFSIAWKLAFYKPDLVYFTFSPTGFAFYRDAIYVMLIKLFGKELIFHLHGKGIAAEAQKNKFYRWLAARTFSNTNVVFLSEILTSDLSDHLYKKKFIVPCGIASVAVALTLKEKVDPIRILYLSNYVRSKGVIDLVDAIEKVVIHSRNFQVHLVGKPYDITIDELKKYIKDKNLDDRVTVCGPRYQEEKREEFRQADLFVFPTYYANEAFPLVLLEAMQWGLPCITTREGGIPDMIEDGISGLLVNQRDINSLAEKILFLLENPEKRAIMGLSARKIFLEKYTSGNFEQNMLGVLNSVMKDRERP